jgi:hypothetical protein
MDYQVQYNMAQNFRQIMAIKDKNFYAFSNNPFNQIYNLQNLYTNSFKATIDTSSADTDSYSYQNANLNCNHDKQNIFENRIVIKNPDGFIAELFKAFSEKNSICNFTLFEKSIDIKMNLEKKLLKKISLKEYFNFFRESIYLCLNIPYLDKKCRLSHNIFNPSLSSMNLLIKSKNIRKENINRKYLNDNFSLFNLSEDLIKLKFDEKNPPYNRDIIQSQIDTIHKILGKNKIPLNDIIKENSYFSILWTPADTYKIKSSFLSYYTFDFKLVGTLVIKVDDYEWFTTFCTDINNYKYFKREYLNKINNIENFIKKCHNVNEGDKIAQQIFSNDYKRFVYNH